jgi:hypothetical protein
MLGFELKKTGKILEMLGREVRSYRFALAAFLIPVFIRSIPEILVGPYPIGWDTIAFYVPNTLDWATGKTGWLTMLGTAPLMYMMSVPIYMISHVNPVWIFKVMGPLLYGGMIFALFRFLRLGLGWNPRQALGGALLTSLYFVTLRVSWDLYRNMLGLTFILVAIVILQGWKGTGSLGLLALSIIGAVASDQLTGVIVLFLLMSRAVGDLLKGRRAEFMNLVIASAPGLALFLSIVYVDFGILGISLGQQQPSFLGLQSLSNSLGFLAFAYLPLSPLVVIGLRSISNLELKSWSYFCIAAALTSLLPFPGLNVSSYRWSLLTSVPLCVLAAAGLARIGSLQPKAEVRRWLQVRLVPIFSIIMIFSTILYIALPAQQAMPYYATFPSLLPTSMVQDTVPSSDMQSLKVTLEFAAASMGPGTVLITHQAIYGWARAYLPSGAHILNYAYSTPLDGVRMAKEAGYSSVLMIWWINGSGWHGQITVPSGFVPLLEHGNIALYAYY